MLALVQMRVPPLPTARPYVSRKSFNLSVPQCLLHAKHCLGAVGTEISRMKSGPWLCGASI